ncbi:MAG: hypothetical protein ACRENP_24110, partial [Longimicrobiales bacterium]
MTRDEISETYALFRFGNSGLGNLFSPNVPDEVYQRLKGLDQAPITKVQLNQLLVLSTAGSISDGFFRYYWRHQPEHPYNVARLPFYNSTMTEGLQQEATSHDHLRWGFYRLYLDGLL